MTDPKDVADDGSVPFDELEEITDRISLFELMPQWDMTDDELDKVMSSFEKDLAELNRMLTGAVNDGNKKLKVECEKAKEKVEQLSHQLEQVRGDG